MSLSDLRLRATLARIGDVASTSVAPAMLGRVRLRHDQRLAVARVLQALARDGGCLLADDVGRGKTFVALAVARQWSHPLVVIPASLRQPWLQAMRRATVQCALVTHEALSAGRLPNDVVDGIVVDESHHFRSPAAKRYAALASIAAHTPLLLLSATPLQNRTRDLAAQVALFRGGAAFRCAPFELARHVVRGADLHDGELPIVAPPQWIRPACDDGAVLEAIVSLPSPAKPVDAGDAGALRTIGLVRAWASSRAALIATLRRRRRVATAIEQCAASGVAPSRRDLRAWQAVGDDVQLALAPLLVGRSLGDDVARVAGALAGERDALDELARALARLGDPDLARVATLRELRAKHAGERIIAFSEFASTVRAYFSALRGDPEVGMLTATEARIASGRLPRDALLDRFAPDARGARPPERRERVTLLLATDLLSEGVNLQDASVIVHLDLPWNPARLAQRVGRVRRPGGATVVHSYLVAPPARSGLLLQVESRLRDKMARAERTIGHALHVLPALVALPRAEAHPAEASGGAAQRSAAALGAVAERVASWRRASRPRRTSIAPLVAGSAGPSRGWLVALDDGRLLAGGDEPEGDLRLTDDPAAVTRAVSAVTETGRAVGDGEAELALVAAARWLAHEHLALDCGVAPNRSALDVALERRIARAVRRAPRHERPATLSLAARLRASIGRGGRSLGVEGELAAGLESHPDREASDRDWLQHALAIVERSRARVPAGAASRVVALVILGQTVQPAAARRPP